MIGAHVSAAGGVHHAPENAYAEGVECFQFFSRPPQGGKAPELTPEIVEQFRSGVKKHAFNAYIHAPYFVNMASANNRVYFGSVAVLREELERGSLLGVKAVVAHIGSAGNGSYKAAMTLVRKALGKIFDGYAGSTQLLLEISAGAGAAIGAKFESIAELLGEKPHAKLGVCFDTCHAFASGYDLRSGAAVNATLQEFQKAVGLKYLKLCHVNDSRGELGGALDRHAHIGKGRIGTDGIAAFVNHPKLRKLDFILETPLAGRAEDVKILKALRS